MEKFPSSATLFDPSYLVIFFMHTLRYFIRSPSLPASLINFYSFSSNSSAIFDSSIYDLMSIRYLV